MNKEKLINQIMQECADAGEPVTEAEATEMAEMELKEKESGRRYERSKATNKPTTRKPKIDQEKVRLIDLLNYCLMEPDCVDDDLPFEIENVYVANEQKEILFDVGENEYSIILVKHRKKK